MNFSHCLALLFVIYFFKNHESDHLSPIYNAFLILVNHWLWYLNVITTWHGWQYLYRHYFLFMIIIIHGWLGHNLLIQCLYQYKYVIYFSCFAWSLDSHTTHYPFLESRWLTTICSVRHEKKRQICWAKISQWNSMCLVGVEFFELELFKK